MLAPMLRAAAGNVGGGESAAHFWRLDDGGGGPYVDSGGIGEADLSQIGTVTDDGAFGGVSVTGAGAVGAADTSDIFDGIMAGADKKFSIKLGVEFDNFTADQYMVAKLATSPDERQFLFLVRAGGTIIDVLWYGALNAATYRLVRKTGLSLSTGTEYTLAFSYDGSIDTNDGLDRVSLYIDGAVQTGLTIAASGGSLPAIVAGPAYFALGASVSSSGVIGSGPCSANFKNLRLYDYIISSGEAA